MIQMVTVPAVRDPAIPISEMLPRIVRIPRGIKAALLSA
jgi:hypothetical protein